ncbi:MAG: four helix bundle protein [Ferruginibacter sp.]
MATARSFEDLDIWKKSQHLGMLIYELCDRKEKIIRDYSFKDQLKRAALSISNNIAEGFEYSNNKDFFRFLRIAKGSCGEVRNCLLFSIKVKYTHPADVHEAMEYTRTIGSQIGRLLNYLKSHREPNAKPVTSNL